MDPFDPVLDQPQVIEFDDIPGPARNRLANQDIYFDADANSDLYDLHWPWADECYAKSIRMHIQDPGGEELMTLVTRYYAGYQETILGNEGMIISKRLTAPLGSHYDRTALWTLECQAEGDRLLRLDVEIDWGDPLTQRIVDGLLVAQSNPRRAQGIYKQRNADRTCVLGNPLGRPSSYEFDDDGHAVLTYYVLVNGIVDVSVMLTVSDVGEQVAWSGFLALRDTEREFEDSTKRWDEVAKTGRLWTSDPRLNRAVQAGKLVSMRHVQRTRTGLTPSSGRVADSLALVDCLDTFDVTMSRNLLAHLRRVAEKSDGRVPVEFPVRPRDPVVDPGSAVVETNAVYFSALYRHLSRHPDSELLAKHMPAVTLCADSLVRLRWERGEEKDEDPVGDAGKDAYTRIARALSQAAELAAYAGDDANAARWESEAHALGYESTEHAAGVPDVTGWLAAHGWRLPEDEPWGFSEPQGGIRLAGEAVWCVAGLKWHEDALWVYPTCGQDLRWWALVDVPLGDESATLVWDGGTLHATRALHSDRPVQIHDKIRVVNTEEHEFDLTFELINDLEAPADAASRKDRETKVSFRPVFDRPADE